MSETQSSWEQRVRPVVVWRAKRIFRLAPDRLDKICDAVSLAWEWHQRYPHAPAKSLAYYACKRVKRGHQFGRSARSVDGPNPRGVTKPNREYFSMRHIGDDHDDPAELAALRIDFVGWQHVLSPRERMLLADMIRGETTQELARKFGVSRGRISQIRRELLDSWQVYTA